MIPRSGRVLPGFGVCPAKLLRELRVDKLDRERSIVTRRTGLEDVDEVREKTPGSEFIVVLRLPSLAVPTDTSRHPDLEQS